ncbi:hypothetical protein FR224_17040 [Salmonella enterica subsp. diarizonae]|uniref:Uncharacterized protein n=1 Tax=Salmonella muenchen TaxID=596 RepID=A0A5W3IT17_SALMU|nr:hypothetical protein [Salmonella enterica subsp. enterica serovar Muenchen]ECJ2403573.1 hypothetical protein [Salmonella enterica subsp. diarizonae]EKG5019519.1 hypothetical protein [Salmonella enterica]ECK8188169.1 hypothetical protein [Salmonella enterica subsp. diarizonae]EDU3721047.1 hypothetical protein [Salmonella enterica subsp. diarizonae]
MRASISYVDDHHLSVRVDEIVLLVPAFPTKKAAVNAGAPFGWRVAILIERRFESVWVVGKKCFQSDNSACLNFEAFRFPLLKWEKEGGIIKCPILSVRRFKQETAQ